MSLILKKLINTTVLQNYHDFISPKVESNKTHLTRLRSVPRNYLLSKKGPPPQKTLKTCKIYLQVPLHRHQMGV